MRSSPNIVITGTPGTGKTTHAEILAERTGLRHVSVNQIVKDKGCHEGWDDEYQSWIVDEDKVRQDILSSCFHHRCGTLCLLAVVNLDVSNRKEMDWADFGSNWKLLATGCARK